ncbi:MAG: PQQ-dependent sugar dehydrogenase [bacterium]|nr:PQQ-dependent sugar dehydrogenase [bacterium]
MLKTLLPLLALLLPVLALAQTTVRIATGLARPLFVTHAPADFSRIFIAEQHEARIRVFHLDTNTLDPVPFLDIDSIVVSSGNERGLLGLAFHPDYQNNGYFFVSYNDNSGTSVIARYTVSADPDSAVATSRFNILTQTQPYENHNGGCIHFGPDGYLYIGLGDGGSGNDPQNNAQNTNSLLGKMLRIDVNTPQPPNNYGIPANNPFVGVPGYRPEIWTLGLRNPWRWSFDRLTGDMYVGDVGQDAWEEVDVEAASDTGGRNYGWRCMEGFNCTGLTGCICNSPDLTLPVTAYSHGIGCSITGGYVYRGCAIPSLYGSYFYADYCSAQIWSFRWDGANGTTDSTEWTAAFDPAIGSIAGVSSFGEDAYGELYICDLGGGEVFKVIPDSLVDCNGNNIADPCDIESGTSVDVDRDGLPDECDNCFHIEVSDLAIVHDANHLNFRWTNLGGDSARYTLYSAPDNDASFPAGWTVVAQNLLPDVANQVTYSISPFDAEPNPGFYKVVTVCP